MRRIRAIAHVHSTWSYDGTWTLDDIAHAFRRRGYDAVLMAEHDRGFDEHRWAAYKEDCARVSRERVLLVPGIEYSDPPNTVHVAVWGDLPFLGEGRTTRELLGDVAERGGVAVLAHPGRRQAWRQVDPSWLPLLRGIEVWNRKYDGWSPSRRALPLLEPNGHLVPFVGPDFHTKHQFFPLGMDLEVDELTEHAIFAALGEARCSPMAFRLPAGWLTREPLFSAARAAEAGRRRVAPRVRARIERLRRGP